MAYKYLNDDGLKAYTKKVKTAIANAVAEVKLYFTTQKVTWSELKALRDAKKLVAGKTYRITDFVTTSVQAETRSAGHAFDIIVVADDESTLNENARAILHKGDTYFKDCKLNAWELKYCLDNDTHRFAWADATNGKGVVWWMKDEWNNECFYDFKNIQYKRYKVTSVSKNLEDCGYVGKYVGIYGNITNAGLTTNSEFKWAYTFNLYTFATQGDPTSDIIAIEDSSVVQRDLDYDAGDDKTLPNVYHYFRKCTGNKFSQLQSSMIVDDVQYNLDMLPNISCLDYAQAYDENQADLFTVHYCYGNRIDDGCFGISFGTEVCGVKVGKDCKGITCGDYCYSWTCGNNCYSWTCGNEVSNTKVLQDYVSYFHLDDGVSNITIKSSGTPTYNTPLKNFVVKAGVKGTGSNTLAIVIDASSFPLNSDYEWTIAKNSSGAVKQYCEADLIN